MEKIGVNKVNYREIVDFITKGLNFEKNACVIGGGINEPNGLLTKCIIKGDDEKVELVLTSLIESYIKNAKKDKAIETAYRLKDVILKCISEIRSVRNE